MKRIAPILMSCCVALAIAACGDAGASAGWTGTVDTLANGAILVSNPEQGMWGDSAEWRLEEDLRLGTADDAGPEVFGQVRDLEVDELGRIYVLDNQAKEVRVFGTDGRHLRTLGGPGGGPGEMENPNGVAWDPAGRLWVADPRNARYAVFDTAGSLVGHRPRPVTSWGWRWNGVIADDWHLYETGFRRTSDGQNTSVLLRIDTTGVVVDTLPFPQYRADFYQVRTATAGMSSTVPFSPRLHALVDHGGTLWSGVSDRYRLVRQSLRGDTLLIVDREHRPVPVTSAERDEALSGDGFRRMREMGGEVDPGRIPPNKPAFGGVTIDDPQHLWVRAVTANEDETYLDVFDPEGRYLGRLRSPYELDFFRVRGDAVYAIVTDDLDVQYVVRLRIAGRADE